MKYWSVAQVAEMVGLKPVTIRWHITHKNIAAKKLGRDWLISTAMMDVLMRRSTNKSIKQTRQENG
jgi:hypothetical protein